MKDQKNADCSPEDQYPRTAWVRIPTTACPPLLAWWMSGKRSGNIQFTPPFGDERCSEGEPVVHIFTQCTTLLEEKSDVAPGSMHASK